MSLVVYGPFHSHKGWKDVASYVQIPLPQLPSLESKVLRASSSPRSAQNTTCPAAWDATRQCTRSDPQSHRDQGSQGNRKARKSPRRGAGLCPAGVQCTFDRARVGLCPPTRASLRLTYDAALLALPLTEDRNTFVFLDGWIILNVRVF